MQRPLFVALTALTPALLASGSTAQEMLRHHFAAGSPMAIADQTGDGVRDYVTIQFGTASYYVLVVRSGASGVVLQTYTTNQTWNDPAPGPWMWPLSDIDHDGVDDVGLQRGVVLHAYSAVTGALLRTFSTPSFQTNYGAVVGLNDIDGDGVDDIAIGEPRVGIHCSVFTGCIWYGAQPGRVEILSGASGAVVRSIIEPPAPFGLQGTMFGARVVNLGDFDGDGADDMLVSNYYGLNGPTPIYVDAYSSATGALLFHMPFPTQADGYGYDGSLAAPGDVDGDGVPDFAVAEPTRSRVRMFSGATRAQLFTSWGGPYSTSQYPSYGSSLFVVDDMNGDGVRDLAINAPQPNEPINGLVADPFSATGYAVVVSSTDGRELWTRVGQREYEAFSVQGSLDDIDGDGRSELFAYSYDAAGTPQSWGTGVFSSRLGYSAPTNYCTSVAHISAVGSTSVSANDVVLAVQGAQPNTSGYFLAGTRAIGGGTGNLPCVLGPGLRLAPRIAVDAQGNTSRSVQLSNSALFLAGTTWNFQFTYAVDWPVVGMHFSDALSVTFTP